nr:HAD domain-containing protein [Methylorubrum extorquens]
MFLDVDGVLNADRTPAWRGRDIVWRVEAACVGYLNEVLDRTGATVVVSSAWRIGPHRGPEGCRAMLRERGVRARFHRDWRTKRMWGGPRGDEIAEWLSRHPEVTSWAIVDDDSDLLPGQRARFVQTSGFDGLTRSKAELLVAILNDDAETVARLAA